jgi:hypothetical protein
VARAVNLTRSSARVLAVAPRCSLRPANGLSLDLIWTLCAGRRGPLGNGLSYEINKLHRSGTLETAAVQLEVVAGAISWGFKSPSPHHILNGLTIFGLTLFTYQDPVLDLMFLGTAFSKNEAPT